MPGSKALALLQNRTKALECLDKLYHKSFKQDATPAEQEQYSEFRLDMLTATFGVREGLLGIPMLDISAKELISPPVFLEAVLADYERATRCSASHNMILRSRLDTMLYLTHACVQRSAVYGHGHELITPTVVQHINEVSFATGKQIAQNITCFKNCRSLNGIMDYTVWWGSEDDLETNLVVIEAKAHGAASLSHGQALISMARKNARKKDCRVFGISTDSYSFYFLAIDNNSVWSFRYVRWSTTAAKIEIIGSIAKIIREAAMLVPISTRFSLEMAHSARSKTGCVIRDVGRDVEMEGVDEVEIW
ncbi:hypothetical protein BJX63DRAFT_427219 [Aspergillus granulosus]|uniref:Uncharacterized protein n=1 Tax=Aspergillus granulosus TaxID=176169 RepID=A0ABR4I4I8_9EURO